MADDHDPRPGRRGDAFSASQMGKQYLSRTAANIIGVVFIIGLIGAVILGVEVGVWWGLGVAALWSIVATVCIGVYGSLKNEIGPPPTGRR
jgi:hypothetical protein